MPLELRLLTSRTAEDEEREREFEAMQRLEMQERMRRQEEVERLRLAQRVGLEGAETESEETSSDEDGTDYRQEIERFKNKQEMLLKKRSTRVHDRDQPCLKPTTTATSNKRRQAKFDIKFEMARIEALRRLEESGGGGNGHSRRETAEGE